MRSRRVITGSNPSALRSQSSTLWPRAHRVVSDLRCEGARYETGEEGIRMPVSPLLLCTLSGILVCRLCDRVESSDHDPLDLIEGNLIAGAIIEFCRARTFVCCHDLRFLQ